MPGTAAHPRARYTKTQKAQAVGVAVAEGSRAAAAATGIPESTIRYWTEHPEFAQLRATTRDALAEQMWAVIQMGVVQVGKGLQDPDVPYRDKVIAVGVLYDKHALLTGSATSRSESRDLTGTPSDADVIRWLRELDGVGREAPAPAGVEGAPKG